MLEIFDYKRDIQSSNTDPDHSNAMQNTSKNVTMRRLTTEIEDMEGGFEGLQGRRIGFGARGSIHLNSSLRRIDASSVKLVWFTWGAPNPAVEAGFTAVAPRTSKKINHYGAITFKCKDDDNSTYTVDYFEASKFPSHKLFVTNTLQKYIPQVYLSNLWEPAKFNPAFAK